MRDLVKTSGLVWSCLQPHDPEVLVPHANAPLTERGRLILCRRIAAGRPVAHVAAEMGISRQTAYRWWNRYQQAGPGGLADRPTRTPASIERRVVRLRRQHKLGPARIASRLGLAPSTVHRVLVLHGLNRLDRLDRPTGEPIRRYEHARPGELVHIDIKKLGAIDQGGGWRMHGLDSEQNRARKRRRARGVKVGYEYVHSAVDDTPVWPTARSYPTRPPPRRSRFGPARRPPSPPTASPSNACSPTTAPATAPAPSAPC